MLKSYPRTKKWLLIGIITLPLYLLDQLTKLFALIYEVNQPLISPWFNLKLEKNIGIAFSIPLPEWLLLPLTSVFLIGLVIFLGHNLNLNKPFSKFLLGLFLAGALGNWMDRYLHHYVIDFISIGNFPVFNLADSFLSISIFLIIVFYGKINRNIHGKN